jgi:hypothetical protein
MMASHIRPSWKSAERPGFGVNQVIRAGAPIPDALLRIHGPGQWSSASQRSILRLSPPPGDESVFSQKHKHITYQPELIVRESSRS